MIEKETLDKIIELRDKGFTYSLIAESLSTPEKRYSKQAIYNIYSRYMLKKESEVDDGEIRYLVAGIYLRVGESKQTIDIVRNINCKIKISSIRKVISEARFIKNVKDAMVETLGILIDRGMSFKELKESTKLNGVEFKDSILIDLLKEVYYLKALDSLFGQVMEYEAYTGDNDKAKELFNKFNLKTSYTIMYNRFIKGKEDSILENIDA